MSRRGTYHHGDLRAALVEAALALISEKGVAGLSVAEVARRAEVSAAAPYRHFPTRIALLSAAATAAGRELSDQLGTAIGEVGAAGTGQGGAAALAVEEMASATRAYVRFALTRGAAFELVLADELQDFPDGERREVTRELFDLLLWPAITVTGHPAAAERLLRSFSAVAHGFAYLPRSGFMRGHSTDVELVAEEAAGVVRTLAHAARQGSGDLGALPHPHAAE